MIWSGAEYRGRGRQSIWRGCARFDGCTVQDMKKINAWNPERLLQQRGGNRVEWNAMTTGNFGGFDVWLNESDDAMLDLTCNRGEIKQYLREIGYEDVSLDAGGLERKIRVFRLPEVNPHREIEHSLELDVKADGDNPLWICVTTEDGFQAWSSPIFVFK